MTSQGDKFYIKESKNNSLVFQKLYNKYHQRVYSYFWYRVGYNQEAAEDLMQETFLKAFKNLGKYKEKGFSYLAYLLKIAHNLLVNYFRDQEAEATDELKDIPVRILENIENDIDAEIVWKKIYKLPFMEKEVVLLRYRKEMPIKRIAKIVGKSENAVKLILFRARKRLKGETELKALSCFPDVEKLYIKPRFLNSIKER